jgi:hypothetical protein
MHETSNYKESKSCNNSTLEPEAKASQYYIFNYSFYIKF